MGHIYFVIALKNNVSVKNELCMKTISINALSSYLNQFYSDGDLHVKIYIYLNKKQLYFHKTNIGVLV